MVLSLWAIVMTVHSLNSFRIVAWIRSSVSKSTAAVASSKMSTLVLRSKARAKQINCRCPTLKFSPPSDASWSSPVGRDLTNVFKWACSKAAHTSSSVYESKGSKFILKVPENRTGSCGIIVSRERNAWRPKSAILMPSMVMEPSAASIMRNKPSVSDDLPAPVRPTIPTYTRNNLFFNIIKVQTKLFFKGKFTFSPPLISHVIPLRTKSSPSLYLTL